MIAKRAVNPNRATIPTTISTTTEIPKLPSGTVDVTGTVVDVVVLSATNRKV